jgi:ATP-dependent protease Clp ATPase subunit
MDATAAAIVTATTAQAITEKLLVDVFFDVPDNPEVNAVYVDEEVSFFHKVCLCYHTFTPGLRYAATLAEATCAG